MKSRSKTFEYCINAMPTIAKDPARWQSFVDCQLRAGFSHEDIVRAVVLTSERQGVKLRYKSPDEVIQYCTAILKSERAEQELERKIFYESFPIKVAS